MDIFWTNLQTHSFRIFALGIACLATPVRDPEGGFKYSITFNLGFRGLTICFGSYPPAR